MQGQAQACQALALPIQGRQAGSSDPGASGPSRRLRLKGRERRTRQAPSQPQRPTFLELPA